MANVLHMPVHNVYAADRESSEDGTPRINVIQATVLACFVSAILWAGLFWLGREIWRLM